MPVYKVTVKTPMNSAGYHIEPGMSVEISTMFPIIGVSSMVAGPIRNAFMAKYGVDLQAMNCLNAGFLRTERI